jgi:hypothetical protein
MAHLGWIDFSRSHRDKVLAVMDHFQDEGMVDEMGLGTIRDALSDRMFPGTSTIQTRAKYFLLVPWIIRHVERRGDPDRFLAELDSEEVQFVKILRDTRKAAGIIGARKKNANPKRKPSSVYWNGLRTYGILRFSGSLADYARVVSHRRRLTHGQAAMRVDADGDVPGDDRDAAGAGPVSLWCTVPKPPKEWKDKLDIDLTREEAAFLLERITLSQRDTLLEFAFSHGNGLAAGLEDISGFLELKALPQDLRKLVEIATRFEALLKGALIRYNLLIQRMRKHGNVEDLEQAWQDYLEAMKAFPWDTWCTEDLWKRCPDTPTPTRVFVEAWIELVRTGSYSESTGDALISQREKSTKGFKRARLGDAARAEKQESLVGLTRSEEGIHFLSYRWGTVRTFLEDVYRALEADAQAA